MTANSHRQLGVCDHCRNGLIRCASPSCGALNRFQSSYCRICGRPIDWESAHAQFKEHMQIYFESSPEPFMEFDLTPRIPVQHQARPVIHVEEVFGRVLVQLPSGYLIILDPLKPNQVEATVWDGPIRTANLGDDAWMSRPICKGHQLYIASRRQIVLVDLLNPGQVQQSLFTTETPSQVICHEPALLDGKLLFTVRDQTTRKSVVHIIDQNSHRHVSTIDREFEGDVSRLVPAWNSSMFFFDSQSLYKYTLRANHVQLDKTIPNQRRDSKDRLFSVPANPVAAAGFVILKGAAGTGTALYSVNDRLDVNTIDNTESGAMQFTVRDEPFAIYLCNERGLQVLGLGGARNNHNFDNAQTAEFPPYIYGKYILYTSKDLRPQQRRETMLIVDKSMHMMARKEFSDILTPPLLLLGRTYIAYRKDKKIILGVFRHDIGKIL